MTQLDQGWEMVDVMVHPLSGLWFASQTERIE